MIAASVNFIFASIFVSLAWWSIPRGWNFAKVGWRALQDKSTDNTGLYFFLSGLGWIIGGLVAVSIGLVLAVLTIIQFANTG